MGFVCVVFFSIPACDPSCSNQIPFIHILHLSESLSFNGYGGKEGVIRLATGQGSLVGSCFLDWDLWLLVFFGCFFVPL